MHHPTDRITHTTAFVTPVVEHWRCKRKPTTAKWATLSDQQQGFFYMYHHPTDRGAHTASVTPVVEHWLE